MNTLIENVPEIIEVAGRSTISLVALVVLVLAVLAFMLVRGVTARRGGSQRGWNVVLSGLLIGLLGFVLISSMSNVSRDSSWAADPTPSTATGRAEIVIGAKNFIESSILAEAAALVVEHTLADAPNPPRVRVRHEMGDTIHLWSALQSGKIHMYPEYSGTLLAQHLEVGVETLHEPANHSVRAINKLLGRTDAGSDLEFGPAFGFENSYVMVATRGFVESAMPDALDDGKVTLTELGGLPDTVPLRFAGSAGFLYRPDGLDNLANVYKIAMVGEDPTLHANKYTGLLAGEMEFTDGYTTDPELLGERFIVLHDDLKYFPRYEAGLLTRRDLDERDPRIRVALNQLTDVFDAEDLRAMIDEAQSQGLHLADLNSEPGLNSKSLRAIVRNALIKEGVLPGGAYASTLP